MQDSDTDKRPSLRHFLDVNGWRFRIAGEVTGVIILPSVCLLGSLGFLAILLTSHDRLTWGQGDFIRLVVLASATAALWVLVLIIGNTRKARQRRVDNRYPYMGEVDDVEG